MRALIASILRHWPALAFVTSAAMLAIAHAFETFGHLAPCELCLYERQVYWVALPIAALAFIASQGVSPKVFTPWIGGLLALIFLIGLASLSFHMFATVGTEILDVLFIALFIYFFVGCFFCHHFGWPWWTAVLTLPGFLAFSKLVEMPFAANALNGSVGYLPPIAALLLMALFLLITKRSGGGKLAAAAVIFLISLTLRTMDQAWCLSLPIGTHWLWHCLNAATLALVTLSFDRPVATTAASTSGAWN